MRKYNNISGRDDKSVFVRFENETRNHYRYLVGIFLRWERYRNNQNNCN